MFAAAPQTAVRPASLEFKVSAQARRREERGQMLAIQLQLKARIRE